MIQTLITGFIIGIFISAPVGPLGILTIQRTLSKGRWHGVLTGLGATTSDIIYSVIVGFSMSFIMNFITEHSILIQIIGSIVVVLFGFHLWKSDPTHCLNKNIEKGKSTYYKDYFSALLLCLSNPLVIFLFIGLFARFHFFSTTQTFWQQALGFFSIALGAFVWWTSITLIVSKLRSRFNIRGLLILNKITGAFLLLLGVIGIIAGCFGRTL